MAVFRQIMNQMIKLFITKMATCYYVEEMKEAAKQIKESEYPSWHLFQALVTVGHCFFVMFGHDIYESAYTVSQRSTPSGFTPWPR